MLKKHFWKLLICIITVCCIFSGCTTDASFQVNPTITIINNTGYTIRFVNISETTNISWGPNLLEADQILENGESFKYQVPFPLNQVNSYDFRLVDSDGDEYIKMNVTIRDDYNITFTFADITNPFITIVNNTGNTIWYVYISETTEDTWGHDLLAEDQILRNGESFLYQLPHLISRVNAYDIRLKDSHGDDYIKWEEQVSSGKQIKFTMSDIDIERFIERTR